MKRLLVTLLLLAAQQSQPTPFPRAAHLKDDISDFPRSQLQIKAAGPISYETGTTARASFTTLAEMAGLNVIFDGEVRDDSTTPSRIESADIREAFDLLSKNTGNAVEVLDSHTLIVFPDVASKHLNYDSHVLKTFYLKSLSAPEGLNQVVTALRLLNFRNIATDTAANAVVISATPDRVAVAEKTIAGLDQPAAASNPVASGQALATNAAGRLFVNDADGIHDLTPARSQLQANLTGPRSFQMTSEARASFEALAGMAGLKVVFDSDFSTSGAVPFKADNVDVLDALDLLGVQTRSFWQVLDSKTIIVAPDTPTKRRSYQPLIVKTFYLPSKSSQKDIIEVITALRAVLECRYIAQVPTMNVIAVREVPNKMALVEAIMRDLVQPTGALSSSDPVSSGTESAVPGSEPPIVKTIALPNLSAVGVTEIVTSLRTLLNMRQIDTSGNSIVLRDNAEKVAIAEKLVADFLRPAGH